MELNFDVMTKGLYAMLILEFADGVLQCGGINGSVLFRGIRCAVIGWLTSMA
jgi:hypothetical protein